MKTFKKTHYRFWHSPLALGVFFCLIMYFSYRIIDLVRRDIETQNQKDNILDKKNDLENRIDLLQKDITKLQTDEGKEEVIREKYQVAKEGEKMVVIVGDNKDSNSTENQDDKKHGFLNWLKELFK